MADMIYPVQNIRQAISVLNPNFDITDIDELYVDFNAVRALETFNSLLLNLGVIDGVYDTVGDYVKILYTGHTGCGKSTELIKLHHYLNHKDRYFSIYIDVQDSFQISRFEPEDLYILLITKLVETIKAHDISCDISDLIKLADEWINDDAQIIKEINNKEGTAAGMEMSAGLKLLHFLSIKGSLKTEFSYDSKISNVIRKNIKTNQNDYIITFNEILLEINKEIRAKGSGKEIIFIIDGIEKMRFQKYDTYVQTFFRDARLIQGLKCNLICCVPIDTSYDIQINPLIDGLYLRFTLPLITVNEQTLPLFRQIITKRVDSNTFIDNGVLDYCIEQSGGNPRQLIRIVETAITYSKSNNFKVSMAVAQKTTQQLGLEMRRTLTSTHAEKLRSGDFKENADKIILDLLYSLAVLEYNGNDNNRKINPLLIPFFPNAH